MSHIGAKPKHEDLGYSLAWEDEPEGAKGYLSSQRDQSLTENHYYAK